MTSLASIASALSLDTQLRIGFLARVSNEEKQDPSLSIPRQYRTCRAFIDDQGWRLARSCWDIESGRKDLNLRGTGADGTLFGIDVARDGGLPELIEFARHREIDAVVVESIDRVSRATDSIVIERELARYNVPIFATDEPVSLNATAVLTRRMKQAIAEFYVAELLEKSRSGMIESVHQGWHPGGPIPYGYLGEQYPHPNPHKPPEGATKTKLVVCPIRGPVVLLIFTWYVVDGIGLGEIVDRARLREELKETDLPGLEDRDAKIRLLTTEIGELERAIDKQVLAFEKYDDPQHPVVIATERRIVELHNRRTQLNEELAAVEAEGHTAPAPDLADILETLPDLRPALASYSDRELAELFDAFDLEARYNHLEKSLTLSVAVFPELAEILRDERPLEAAGRRNPSIAGAGFEPATSGL